MKLRLAFLRVVGLALILLGSNPALATIRTVTSLDDNAPGSLRADIISIAASGDTINFAVTGTILLTTGPINNLGKNLTIDNASGPNTLKVERSSAVSSFRIFQIEGGTVSITGLAMSNGKANVCSGGSAACTGGGIFIDSSTTLTLNNCVIAGNEAFYGGGIGNSGTLTLSDCTIENNSASGGTQSSRGGGIINQGTLTASRCTINDNDGKNVGGAIVNAGTLTLVNSTLFDNYAATGGAIYNSASLSITSCTISRNGSFSFGGGRVYNNSGNLSLRNTILETGLGAYNANLAVNQGTITSLGYNLSNDDGNGLLTGTGDQINVNPQFDPYGLRYDGGYTKTVALTPGSPAIDKGKSFDLTGDQRGQPRPVDNPFVSSASGGDGSDIGAYETPSDTTQSATNLIVTTSNDHDDGVCGSLDCSLREAINRANILPGGNTIILDGSLQPTIALQTRTLGELVVSDSTSIVGPGARVLALSSDGYNRVFTFLAGASTVSGLTIRDGISSAGLGTGGTALGGGIYNQATLTINDCTIGENHALGGSGGAPGAPGGIGAGGGIFNVGTLTLNRCAFIHNRAFGGSGAANLNPLGSGGDGGRAQGSAIFCTGTATLVNNCTFYDNVANGGNAGQGARFGGNGGNAEGTIFNESLLTVTASALSGNHGLGGTRGLGNSEANHGVYGAGRGGLFTTAGSSTVRNTISASNIVLGIAVSVDVHGAYLSEGFNVIGSADHSTGFTQPTDQTGTYDFPLDPRLGPMQNNGGPTDTMALLYGSPAIDRGEGFGLTSDQRGSARVVDALFANAASGDGCDIGTVEMNLIGGLDSDSDGMSDDFERFFGVNDPSADSDSDGQSNLAEFNAGTNPLVAELIITAIAVNGPNVTVIFQTAIVGNSYRLERKNTLTDVMWGQIPGLSDFSPATNGPAQITDLGGVNAPTHFYRVRRLP